VPGFKVKASSLVSMLNIIAAEGKDDRGDKKRFNERCLLIISEGSISCAMVDEMAILYVSVSINIGKKGVIGEGEIPIDIDRILTFLKRFKSSDTVVVEHQSGKITISRSEPFLALNFATCASDDVEGVYRGDEPWPDNDDGLPTKGDVTLDVKVKLNASDLAEVIKDADQIEFRAYPWVIKKDLRITVRNEDTGAKISREVPASEIINPHGEVTTQFIKGFGQVVNTLNGAGDIECYTAQDNPLYIYYSKDKLEAVYILAYMEEDDIEEDLDVDAPTVVETDMSVEDILASQQGGD